MIKACFSQVFCPGRGITSPCYRSHRNRIWQSGLSARVGIINEQGMPYVETTNLSFAGVPTDTLGGGVSACLLIPLSFPVGNGTKIYGSCGEGRIWIPCTRHLNRK